MLKYSMFVFSAHGGGAAERKVPSTSSYYDYFQLTGSDKPQCEGKIQRLCSSMWALQSRKSMMTGSLHFLKTLRHWHHDTPHQTHCALPAPNDGVTSELVNILDYLAAIDSPYLPQKLVKTKTTKRECLLDLNSAGDQKPVIQLD